MILRYKITDILQPPGPKEGGRHSRGLTPTSPPPQSLPVKSQSICIQLDDWQWHCFDTGINYSNWLHHRI